MKENYKFYCINDSYSKHPVEGYDQNHYIIENNKITELKNSKDSVYLNVENWVDKNESVNIDTVLVNSDSFVFSVIARSNNNNLIVEISSEELPNKKQQQLIEKLYESKYNPIYKYQSIKNFSFSEKQFRKNVKQTPINDFFFDKLKMENVDNLIKKLKDKQNQNSEYQLEM